MTPTTERPTMARQREVIIDGVQVAPEIVAASLRSVEADTLRCVQALGRLPYGGTLAHIPGFRHDATIADIADALEALIPVLRGVADENQEVAGRLAELNRDVAGMRRILKGT